MEDNPKTTLATIKHHIHTKRGKISKHLRAAFILQAIECYEKLEVLNPRACGYSFVVGTITNAQRR